MEDNNMKRGLNSRHISMIAIGGGALCSNR